MANRPTYSASKRRKEQDRKEKQDEKRAGAAAQSHAVEQDPGQSAENNESDATVEEPG